MIADDLVARLEKVRKTGDRRWSARCPAHADKGPSLSVADKDGTILLHCFAGCDTASICSTLGISMSELFPPRNEHERAQYRQQRFAKATIKDLRHEVSIALVVLGDVASGRPLKPQDMERARRAGASLAKLLSEMERASSVSWSDRAKGPASRGESSPR